MDNRPLTIFCDIDGTLVKHRSPIENTSTSKRLEILPGTLEKLLEWDSKGYNIILVTGRKESMREITIKQLTEAGIIFDKLVMGIGGGKRIIINDKKPDGSSTAEAISLKRNIGIKNLEL